MKIRGYSLGILCTPGVMFVLPFDRPYYCPVLLLALGFAGVIQARSARDSRLLRLAVAVVAEDFDSPSLLELASLEINSLLHSPSQCANHPAKYVYCAINNSRTASIRLIHNVRRGDFRLNVMPL